MLDKISSRERVLTTINHQEPDRVPIICKPPAPLEGLWGNEFERVKKLLELGMDDYLKINVPGYFDPEIKTRLWQDKKSDPEHTLIGKEFITPKGTLRMLLQVTEDFSLLYHNDIPLFSDSNIPRVKEFPIKGPEDLKKLSYLLYTPKKEELIVFYERAKQIKKFAHNKGILLEGVGPYGGVLAGHLCGMERMLYSAYDDPGFLQELMEMLHKFEMRRLELILDLGVDEVYINGYCSTSPWFSPALFNKFFAPFIKEEIEIVHQAGAKVSFQSLGKLLPYADIFISLGIDILKWVPTPPTPEAVDIGIIKERIGKHICLWGGVECAHIIEKGTKQDVRSEVAHAIRLAAPGGGLILSFGNAHARTPRCYENVMSFIEFARELGRYPIDIEKLVDEEKNNEIK